MSFMPVDWIFAIIIFVFCIIGLIRGFVKEIFGKAAWVLGIILAIFLYAKVGGLLHSKIQNLIVCNILGFIIVFTVVFVVVKLIGALLHAISELPILNGLDKAFGAMFGLIEGFAIVCFIMFIISIQPFFDGSKLFTGSFFYGLMNSYIPEVKAAFKHV